MTEGGKMTIGNTVLWLKASRPFTFIASIIPVTLGAVFTMKEASFQWLYFILSILAVVFLQASANLLNDYYDYLSKVDTEDSLGSSGTITKGLLASRKVRAGGFVAMGAGLLLGILISAEKGFPVFILGVIGVSSAYFYTGKPLVLKYRGLGTPLVFFIFGPLMVQGSFYVHAHRFSISALFVSIPVGLLTTAILHANDIRDIYHDQKAGIKTLSIIVGERTSHKIYKALLLISYFSILIMSFMEIIPWWSLICMITIPFAIKCAGKLKISTGKEMVLDTFDQDTAKLGAQFGCIFIISVLFSNIIG